MRKMRLREFNNLSKVIELINNRSYLHSIPGLSGGNVHVLKPYGYQDSLWWDWSLVDTSGTNSKKCSRFYRMGSQVHPGNHSSWSCFMLHLSICWAPGLKLSRPRQCVQEAQAFRFVALLGPLMSRLSFCCCWCCRRCRFCTGVNNQDGTCWSLFSSLESEWSCWFNFPFDNIWCSNILYNQMDGRCYWSNQKAKSRSSETGRKINEANWCEKCEAFRIWNEYCCSSRRPS